MAEDKFWGNFSPKKIGGNLLPDQGKELSVLKETQSRLLGIIGTLASGGRV